MSRPKYTKKDTTHKNIVKKCRKLGMILWDTADLGGKVLDIIVFYKGMVIPVEIKSKGNAKNLTKGERRGIKELESVGIYPVIATDIQDILDAFEDRSKK